MTDEEGRYVDICWRISEGRVESEGMVVGSGAAVIVKFYLEI